MNQEILFAQLHSYGIQGVSKYWFRLYLSNRRQNVEVQSLNTSHFSLCLGYIKTRSSQKRINSRASVVHSI